MKSRCLHALAFVAQLSIGGLAIAEPATPAPVATNPPTPPASLIMPLSRTAHFVGELVPLAVKSTNETVVLEAVSPTLGRMRLYSGKPGTLLLDTARLAPGDYALEVNGMTVVDRFTLTAVERRSVASLQDETMPGIGWQKDGSFGTNVAARDAFRKSFWDQTASNLMETGMTAMMDPATAERGRDARLDTLARAGTLYFENPTTRPSSFVPVICDPEELDGMSQRKVLNALSNLRYPNYAGFWIDWDPTGFNDGGRKMLLIYWGWKPDEEVALRADIKQQDELKWAEFKRRTGLDHVTSAEMIRYFLSIGRPEYAPVIDMPTRDWLAEASKYFKAMPEAERMAMEQRIDAYHAFQMGIYGRNYATYMRNVLSAVPGLRFTSSVQTDHSTVQNGQYLPDAYRPLDFRYQSTWNDQVGGPDYYFQWLLVAALLDANGEDKPVWLSNALASAHHRADWPGKFLRVAAHILPHHGSGIGFSLEGFSNIFGGMNGETHWENIKGKPAGNELLAGREFMDRFATLALQGQGDHGVAVLYSKTQCLRQPITTVYGQSMYNSLVLLTRLGYTPRLITEEEIVEKGINTKALMIGGQTVPLPWKVMSRLAAFTAGGGKVLTDGSTLIPLEGSTRVDVTLPMVPQGRPHNIGSVRPPPGMNETTYFQTLYTNWAPAFAAALGDVGHAEFRSPAAPADTVLTLMSLNGGPDAHYTIAVNDSSISSQADWYRVKETLQPVGPVEGFLYDCTAEAAMGKVKAFTCDLTELPVRVFARLPRELGETDLKATQTLTAGDTLAFSVGFRDEKGQALKAALPFHVEWIRPDGAVDRAFYRGTDGAGAFSMQVTVPANVPAGDWKLSVRSLLNGRVASLPVTVKAPAAPAEMARLWMDRVIVRDVATIDGILTNGASVVLPLFGQQAEALAPVAEQVKAVLAKRGVTVEVRIAPAVTNFWLWYTLTSTQTSDNAVVLGGGAIGSVKRAANNNLVDWWSGASGWRSAKPLILLDLAGSTNRNPIVSRFASEGYLWPEVSGSFPGPGRAVVQGLPWTLGPRVGSVVIQATEVTGLEAGANALAGLPADTLGESVARTRDRLAREFHLRGAPEGVPAGVVLTAKGLKTSKGARPLVLDFGQGPKPPTKEEAKWQKPWTPGYLAFPASFDPKAGHPYMMEGTNLVYAQLANVLNGDMRFWHGMAYYLDVKAPGKTMVTFEGRCRYSDGKPSSLPQWEQVLEVYYAVVPKKPRLPMALVARLDGKEIGRLIPVKTDTQEVVIRGGGAYGQIVIESAKEEVVLQLAAELDLPAGQHELMLIPENIVDGQIKWVHVGVTAEAAEAERVRLEAEKKKAEAEKKAAAEAEKKAKAEADKKAKAEAKAVPVKK